MKRFLTIALVAVLTIVSLSSCEKDDLCIHYPSTAQVDDTPDTPQAGDGKNTARSDASSSEANAVETEAESPATRPDNIFLSVRGPQSVTVTAVVLNARVFSVRKQLGSSVEVLSWLQESVPGNITLSIEYEIADGTPKRFTFCATDNDFLPVLRENIAAGYPTRYTVDLYTNEVEIF